MRPGGFNAVTHLGIGEIIVTTKPLLIRTVLGSCVAVTMFDPLSCFSAICHVIYPGAGTPGDHRYAGSCIREMDDRFRLRRILPTTVIVKLFGGATGIGVISKDKSGKAHTNVGVAEGLLDFLGYTISARDVGGSTSRELYFDTGSGEVHIRRRDATLRA